MCSVPNLECNYLIDVWLSLNKVLSTKVDGDILDLEMY